MDMITKEMASKISTRFLSYSTVLMKLYIDRDGKRQVLHIGSGTYVKIGNIHGILTAQHCTVPLVGKYVLGLSGSLEGSEHKFIVEKSSIEIVEIATPITEKFGPDLAFIILADWEKTESIKAVKTFLDLLRDKERMLNDPPNPTESISFVCGVPHERMGHALSEVGFEELIEFEDFCFSGITADSYQRGGYDYIEIDIGDGNDPNIPTDFGGMSGGALWYVPIRESTNSTSLPFEHFLSGVIFYQGKGEDKRRFIRCHGHRSIYVNVIESLT
jgi:hypothetical protein